MSSRARVGQPRQLVEVGAEDAHREVGRGAAEALVDAHAERRGEQDRDAGHLLDAVAHLLLELLERARPVRACSTTSTSERVCGIGSSVRSARPGAAHHVLDLGELAQHVLDAVVEPVDLVERGLGRKTVWSRSAPSSSCGMKSLPTASAEREGRHGDRPARRHRTRPARRMAGVEQRARRRA